jgi:hypothetical protein
MKNAVFWDVTLCCSCKNRRFGGTYSLHYQGDKNRRANNVSSNYQHGDTFFQNVGSYNDNTSEESTVKISKYFETNTGTVTEFANVMDPEGQVPPSRRLTTETHQFPKRCLLICKWDEIEIHLVHRSSFGLLSQPRIIDDDERRSIGGMIWEGKLKYWEKTCPRTTLSTIIFGRLILKPHAKQKSDFTR